ncbi:MAG: UDP-N-acetylmuramate--L-alanine ligase [Parachlamydiales bacterium]
MKYHLLGIGGIGMSALARILLDRKAEVSGTDAKESPQLERLRELGVRVGGEMEGSVVVSSAIPKDHPELLEAKRRGYPILRRSELLRELARPFKTLAVAGCHGKTTTTSLLAWVLLEAGLDPTCALGGMLPGLGWNGRGGEGEYFVLEADESDGSLLNTDPYGAILTGTEADHLDYWKSAERLLSAYGEFTDRVADEGLLFVCGETKRGTSYGFGAECALRATDVRQEGFTLTFTAHFEGRRYPLQIPLIGRHNALNALAVFGLATRLGISEEKIRGALATFPGVERRCQRTERPMGVTLIDDYAHHPTEVKTTLEGIRKAVKERRLVCLFQPHRYTRLKACWEPFLDAFDAADEVWVTEVYSAGEAPIEGISGAAFAEALARRLPKPVLFGEGELGPTDVLVGMGAGDIPRRVEAIGRVGVDKRIIGVCCGGPSPEHNISLVSGRAIHQAISRERYEVRLFELARDGTLPPISELQACDLLIPVFHGPEGEDGQFAAFSEILGIPYVGCDPLSAGICMHKPKIKRLVASHQIPVPPFIDLTKADWEGRLWQIEALHYPLFVKTAASGSSLGVDKVENESELLAALDRHFDLDDDVIVEQGIRGREIEFAVLGNEEVEVPPPGELLTYGRVYTYEAKYETPFETVAVADLPPEVMERGRLLAERVYRLVGCCGLARVDFFLDEGMNWWFNEVNPFPGFTPISLYPKVWEAQGVPMGQLLERLINLGLAKGRTRSSQRRALQWIAR